VVGRTRFELVTFCTPIPYTNKIKANKYAEIVIFNFACPPVCTPFCYCVLTPFRGMMCGVVK